MASQLLSEDQRDYIIQGVREDFRNDGRGCKDYRKFELSTDLITNANASAKVKLVLMSILNSYIIVGFLCAPCLI